MGGACRLQRATAVFGWLPYFACLIATAASAADNPPPAAGTAAFTLAEVRALAGNEWFQALRGQSGVGAGRKGTWDAGALGSMTVLKVKDFFHLYYEAWGVRSTKDWSQEEYNSLQIGHATSADGVHWVNDPANPVLAKGQGGGCLGPRPARGTRSSSTRTASSRCGMAGATRFATGAYAVSVDGTHFTKKGRISHLGGVEDDHVIHDPGSGRYYMYYWDRAHEPMGLFRASAGSETEFDFGKAQALKIEGEQDPGGYKFTHVFMDKGAWYMLYGNFVRPHCPNSTVRLATLPDGVKWTSVNKNLLEGHDGEMLQAAPGLYLLYYGPRNHFDAAGCDVRSEALPTTGEDLPDQARQRIQTHRAGRAWH